MSRILHSLVWATAIIAAALIASANGLSESASLGIVLGLSGAALGALSSGGGCRRRCAP